MFSSLQNHGGAILLQAEPSFMQGATTAYFLC